MSHRDMISSMIEALKKEFQTPCICTFASKGTAGMPDCIICQGRGTTYDVGVMNSMLLKFLAESAVASIKSNDIEAISITAELCIEELNAQEREMERMGIEVDEKALRQKTFNIERAVFGPNDKKGDGLKN